MAALSDASLPLSGFLNIQKDYLNDLAQLTNENKNVAGDLGEIRGRLQQIHTSFQQANTSADQTLTHQSKIQEILDKEHERLISKKDEIDNIHYGKMRAVELNDSYRKRQTEYIRIIVAIIVAILLYIACNMLLPESIIDIPVIIIFVVLIVYCGNILWDIYKRENMNHDRLDLVAPPEANSLTREDTPATTSGTATATATTSVCTGQVCCADGSRWDASMNACIIACPSAATPLSKGNTCVATCPTSFKTCGNACILQTNTCGGTPTVNAFSTLGEERIRTRSLSDAKPYTPYEYDTYAPVM